MAAGFIRTDFVQNLENTLSNRKINEKTANGSSNSISNNEIMGSNKVKTEIYDEKNLYENILTSREEVHYENRNVLIRKKPSTAGERVKHGPKRLPCHNHNKNPYPFTRTNPNNPSNLQNPPRDSNTSNSYHDDVMSIKCDQNNTPTSKNITDEIQDTSTPKSIPSLKSTQSVVDKNSKSLDKRQTHLQQSGMVKIENIMKIKTPPPLPQNSKISIKTPPIQRNAGGFKECILRRLSNSNSNNNTDNFQNEELTGMRNTKEMKGFMECSRLDRSVKVAPSQESWNSYYLFLAEGILSFFANETNVDMKNELPVESTFLKKSVILMNMNIITVHCFNGISYRFTNRNVETVQLWYNSLKDAVLFLKEKEALLPKSSPCLQSTKPENFLNSTGILVSNAIQANKTKLIQFFKKRMTRQELKLLGIYQEPIFGGTLEAACSIDESQGPPTFLKLIIDEITKRGLKEDGIYRKNGSISAIQTNRLKIDEGVYKFDEILDIHTLTGVVKLYFRELASPLIPSSFCDSFVSVIGFNNTNKTETLSNLIIDLPPTHKNTLRYLLKHLRRVHDHESSNRMSMKNISLIFGPTLTWNEGGDNIQKMLTVQAQLVECLLGCQDDLFMER